MLTTQIGSLPFKSIEYAVDYASEFDLPFVPTLPQLSSSELMIDLVLNSFKNNNPKPTELCLIPMLKKCMGKKCKYQIVGPITLFHSLKMQKVDVEYFDIVNFLKKKINEVILIFDYYNVEPIIFFDEPILEYVDNINYELLSDFLINFNSFEIGIHCCSNANWSSLKFLDFKYLSIDVLNLIDKSNKLDLKSLFSLKTIFLGVLPTKHELDHSAIINLRLALNDSDYSSYFLTPTCGLGNSSEQIAESLRHDKIKDII